MCEMRSIRAPVHTPIGVASAAVVARALAAAAAAAAALVAVAVLTAAAAAVEATIEVAVEAAIGAAVVVAIIAKAASITDAHVIVARAHDPGLLVAVSTAAKKSGTEDTGGRRETEEMGSLLDIIERAQHAYAHCRQFTLCCRGASNKQSLEFNFEVSVRHRVGDDRCSGV